MQSLIIGIIAGLLLAAIVKVTADPLGLVISGYVVGFLASSIITYLSFIKEINNE